MDYSELIYNYLDGEISPILEDKLFAEMSINQDLRNELAKQIKINSFALNDLNSIQIPSEVTSKVFSNLGFSIPASNASKSNFAFNFSWLKNNKYRLGVLISSLLILSISGTWFLKDYIDKDNHKVHFNNTIAQTPNNEKENPNRDKSNINTETGIPIVSSSIIQNSDEKIRQNYQTNTNYRRNSNNISANKNATFNPNSFNDIASKSQIIGNDNLGKQKYPEIDQTDNFNSNNNSSIVALFPANIRSKYNNYATNPLRNNENSSQLFIPQEIKSNFELTVNTRAFRQSKTISLLDDKSFFSGSSISLMYKITPEHYIGGDFGEDEFYQEFFYNNGDQMALYQQMPNYFWGAVTYKYIPKYLNIGDLAQIYAKTSFGGCKAGAIGKLQLGLNIPITPSINGFLSGEYSSLFYNINKEFYRSNKFEILYGISLNL